MKYKRILLVGMSLAMTLSIACSQKGPDKVISDYNIKAKELSQPVKKVSDANNIMAFRMLKSTLGVNKNINTIISPMSLSTVLSITQNGAGGSTKEEMKKAIELSGIDDKTINDEYKNIIANFNSIEGLKVKMANSIWIDKGTEIKETFKNMGKKYYESEIRDVDFSKSKTTDTINTWIAKHTAGKIKKIVDKFDYDTAMVLVNTLYFKGDWAVPFKKENTQKKDFNLSNGSSKKIDMMNGDINVEYLKENNFEAIRIPYKDKKFGMYVLLPNANSSVESLMKEMSYENWNKWKKQFKAEERIVEMPKLHIEYEQELNKMLMGYGMKRAFKPGADFSKMSKDNDLYISLVKQKCYIDVDEKGTEAAASTAVIMKETSVKPLELNKFIANRPFIYVITDNKTDSILFMGNVEKP
ncbi:serpin family protein [Clostridium estertheticum]|uniref:serpin family protein n=1 Tax=Clostridium estertheticum TaxID=238834 RepID=UPI001C0C6552|nr:serpin family protein [Clostridium estertheticum]MBU3214928.1 serpin family protein [Clostridium estertheticum]WAG57330.1 serpin family protein [Clostridium estertheticum]